MAIHILRAPVVATLAAGLAAMATVSAKDSNAAPVKDPASTASASKATPRVAGRVGATAATAATAASVKGGAAAATAAGPRWTDATPDGMVDLAKERALRSAAPPATAANGASAAGSEAAKATPADGRPSVSEALAAVALLAHLAPRATFGRAQAALRAVADARGIDADVRTEAALAAWSLAGAPTSEARTAELRALGVVTDVALLGPFRDTGGGLDRREGPEAPGNSYADTRKSYAWGAFDVSWRAIPRPFAKADGVSLDVFIHPRTESCTYVATRLDLAAATSVVVGVASTGQVRLTFDGVDLGKSDDVHASLHFDRLAGRIDADAGPHLVTAKVCASALEDDGRVRLRVTDAAGKSLAESTTSQLKEGKANAKAKVTAVVTPLGRALASATTDADAAVANVVLRTLGGADDTRSPRAPGILDALTRRANVDVDRLALAGWVAPSGANRTGWLNLARARAESENDARTRAFVDRRLVAERVTAKMTDWAMATARSAQLDGAADSEALLLRAVLKDCLGPEAVRIEAFHELARAVDAAKATAPTGMVEQLATLAASFDPARAARARDVLAERGMRTATWVESRLTVSAAAVAEAARAAFNGELQNDDEGLAMARAVARTGNHAAARDSFARMVAYSPNRPEGWAGLSAEQSAFATPGVAKPESAATSAAQAMGVALRRARELAPGEARYRAEIALRKQKAGETEGRDDEKYLVPSQTVLSRRLGVPEGPAPDVADRQLYWLRAVVMHPDKRVSQLIHYAREIVIAPRSQDELYEAIPQEGDLVEILRARVHRKDGGTAFPAEEHNEGDRPRIRWPELAAGDTVEVAIRTWTSRPVGGRGDAPFYFIDYAGSSQTHPLLYNEVVVESAPDQSFYVDVIHGAPNRRDERTENGRKVTRLVWDQPIAIPDEPLSPTMSEVVPVIVGSTFKTWADFRAWYGEAVRGFTEPDEEVRRLAKELTQGKTTRDEKVAALFTFVADDIRYVNYVSGEWWLPNRPQQLLARREGDCDDKAILLIALLKSIGIDAQEVLVQTRLTGEPSLLRAKGAAIPRFDHGIAFLPGPNGGTYLDATSPQSRLGPLSSMDARAVALRMEGPAEIVELPPSSPNDHGSDVDWTIALKADGSADLTGEEKHSGDSAFWARSYLTEEGAREGYVEHYLVGGWFPTVKVDKAIEFKGNLPQGKAWVKYRAHSDGLARQEDGDLVVPLARTNTFTSDLAPLTKRTLPVVLPPYLAPSHETRTTRITPPPGFTVATLPAGGEERGGPFGSAQIEFRRDTRDPKSVVVRRTVTFDTHRIPVERYGDFRTWLQRVDSLMNKKLRLVPTAASVRKGTP